MKLKAFVYLFLIFAGSSLKAETRYLLLDPGASQNSNYYRYYNQVRKAYETLKAENKDVHIFGKNGTWTLTQQSNESLSNFSLTKEGAVRSPNQNATDYPKISGPIRNAQDISQAIKSIQLKPGDSLVINVVAHGGPATNPSDPSTSTLIGWGGTEIKFSELDKVLAEVPDSVRVKLITQTCFGGGVHSISRSRNNVCSASTTNHLFTESAGGFQEAIFSESIWKFFKESGGKTSFAELNLNGFRGDSANQNLGRLSSFDYVDYVLKKGPYEKNRPDGPARWITVNGQKIWQKFATSDYSTSLPPDAEILSKTQMVTSVDAGTFQNYCSSGVQNDLGKVSRLAQTLNEIAQQAVVQDLKKKSDRQPAQVRTIFHDVIDDMKKNGPKYLQISKMYDEKYKDIVRRWNVHKEKFKDRWGITKWWYGEGDERAKFQNEFDTLKANSERDLQQYSFNHQMLERLERLDEFNKKATPEQKKKFVQLLQCEWEPL